MAARTDLFDLGRLSLSPGQGRRLDSLSVLVDPFGFGGQEYAVAGREVPILLDVSRMTGGGYSLRLQDASPAFGVDAREIDAPGGGDEMSSPYVEADEELNLHDWARDALALALPAQIVCKPDCAGLCPVCGKDLNTEPHEHAKEPDPRWSALRGLKLEG
jgi:uncharacterized protein